jgi:putative Ca2+/H+ antiporter (TMEM165/GDT1 family)
MNSYDSRMSLGVLFVLIGCGLVALAGYVVVPGAFSLAVQAGVTGATTWLLLWFLIPPARRRWPLRLWALAGTAMSMVAVFMGRFLQFDALSPALFAGSGVCFLAFAVASYRPQERRQHTDTK